MNFRSRPNLFHTGFSYYLHLLSFQMKDIPLELAVILENYKIDLKVQVSAAVI